MITQSAIAGASPSRARYLTPAVTPSTRPPSTSTPPAIGFFGVLRAIRAAARLTSTERLVLLVIASHLDNATGEACPGIPKLAAECRLTTRTIERTIAALVAAGWLTRDSAASRWGTNVYRVTPRPDDVRAVTPRPARGRPFDRVTPDAGSGPPPSRVHATPDAGSGILPSPDLLQESAVNAPAREPHTHADLEVDQEHGEHEAPVAPVAPVAVVAPLDVEHEAVVAPVEPVAVLAALVAHPELRALARPPVAALLAAEGRPLSVVRRALAELAAAVTLAAAAGEPWSGATLARKARAFVRCAYADPVTSTSSTSTPPEPPPPPPRLASTVGNLRALRAALDVAPSTPHPRRRW